MTLERDSPFDYLPDEIIIKIFSNIRLSTRDELKNRLALEHVNTRFQHCARVTHSWTTELIYDLMDENGAFIRKHLEKMVERMPRITKLLLRIGNAQIWPQQVPKFIAEFMNRILPHMDKFKLVELTLYDNGSALDFKLADRFLTSPTLRKVCFYGIRTPFVKHCFETLTKSPNLTHLTLCNLHRCGQASREQLDILINRVRYLQFENCDWASAENLSERLNIPNESRKLKCLKIEHDKFDLGHFCKRLDPEVVTSLERFELKCDWPESNIQSMASVMACFMKSNHLDLNLALKCSNTAKNIAKNTDILFGFACDRPIAVTANLNFGSMTPDKIHSLMSLLPQCQLSFNGSWSILTMESTDTVVRILAQTDMVEE